MEQKKTYVYDVETLSNCFTYTALDKDSDELIQFVVWKNRNDIIPFLQHLTSCRGMIGFNNINFDYPVIHYIIQERNKLAQMDGDKIAKLIYKKAQSIISQEYSAIKDEDVFVPQLDLFRIWHYDNKARMTSLKKLEIALNFPNVQDMPYSHEHKVTKESEVQEILDYNLNDVEATKLFYTKTLDKLELRKGLMKKYGLNCLNYPDSKIGEQLMLKLYCQATNQDENIIKKKRTYRNIFKFSDCIPEHVKYYTPEFNRLLDYIKTIEVTELKDSFKYEFTDFNLNLFLGTGGLHHCIKPGIYESTENLVIYDADVSGMYPSIAVVNKLYPEHLGEEFPIIYNDNVLKPRLHAKEKVNGVMRDKVMAEGYKLSGNSVYGKSNSEYSFLYDPLYTLKTTLTGQLDLCMLTEFFIMKIPNIKILQINTDGLTVMFDKQYTDLYFKICNYWQQQTKLNLEYVNYSKMIIRDVNNYISVSTHEMFHDGEKLTMKEKTGIKYKGTFKPNHEMIKDGEYHKSFSQGVVSLAVADYFLKGIPIEQTIKESNDIYLFCKTFNATHGWKCETVDSQGNIETQQKTNRYYISTNGRTFRKLKDERVIEIEAGGTLVTIFNKFEEKPFEEYNVDYDYYINECFKIVHKIDGTEERLEQERKEAREKAKLEKEEENYLKYIINKIPTQLQYNNYWREHCALKYGEPKEIKPSKVKV